MQVLNKGEYTGEIVQKTSIEDVIITNTYYSSKKNNPEWHYHENLHICFVFQGGKAQTKKATQYTKPVGSLFFYHSEEKHRWIPSEAVSKSANIEIGRNFIKNYDLSEAKIREAVLKKVDVKTLILKMQNEMHFGDDYAPPALQSVLLELVSDTGDTSLKEIPKWVVQLKELLKDEWNNDLTLSQMACMVKVHPVTISKFFRRYFSCTLGEYRRKLKIEKSIDLIKNSNLSLSEIAFYCHFSDQSHFIRNFKKSTGFRPGDFRNF